MSDNDSSRPGGIAVGHVEHTRIEVKETGKAVTLRDEVHARTNHYIKMSRPYFPNTKLRTYIDYPCFLNLAYLLCFGSLFGALGFLLKELPLGFFVVCTVFFLIYCQHEWVNQKSLAFVRRQLVIDDQRLCNNFYELTVTELNGVALENYEAGMGFVQLTQGKIKLQAFNKIAVTEMARAKCRSRLMLVLFFLTSVYNLYFMVVAYSG